MWNTINLCDAPDCVVTRVEWEDLLWLHLPTHDIMKVRCVVHMWEFKTTAQEARKALVMARAVFAGKDLVEDSSDGESDDHNESGSDGGGNNKSKVTDAVQKEVSASVVTRLACAVCDKQVTQPCWYCMRCNGPCFISCSNSLPTFGYHR